MAIIPGGTTFPQAAMAINVVLQLAQVLGINIDDDEAHEVRAKLTALLQTSIADVAGLGEALAGKIDDSPAAVANSRLANMPQHRLKGRVTAEDGPPEDLTPGQVLDVLDEATEERRTDFAGGLIELIAAGPGTVNFQVWRDGPGIAPALLHAAFEIMLSARQVVPFNAGSPVIDYGDAEGEDPDAGKCRSLWPVVEVTGNCAATFSGIAGSLTNRLIPVLFLNDGAVTATIDIVTGNGITIAPAFGVVNPGLDTGDGDYTIGWVWFYSATRGEILGWSRNA